MYFRFVPHVYFTTCTLLYTKLDERQNVIRKLSSKINVVDTISRENLNIWWPVAINIYTLYG